MEILKTLTVYYAISHLFLVMLQVDINKKKGGRRGGETLNLAILKQQSSGS